MCQTNRVSGTVSFASIAALVFKLLRKLDRGAFFAPPPGQWRVNYFKVSCQMTLQQGTCSKQCTFYNMYQHTCGTWLKPGGPIATVGWLAPPFILLTPNGTRHFTIIDGTRGRGANPLYISQLSVVKLREKRPEVCSRYILTFAGAFLAPKSKFLLVMKG